MKTCFKCHHLKPLSEFYRHSRMADGHLNKCKDCTRKDVNKNRADRLDKYREYDRDRASEPHRRAISRATRLRHVRMYGKSYTKSHNAVSRAVKKGTLVRPTTCQRCPATECIQAHHDSYDRPLDVMWLCPVCHAQRHKELGRLRTLDRMYGEQPDPLPDH